MNEWKEQRRAVFEKMKQHPPDLVIAGGGVTGAGIAREAALAGLKVLLVESMDFGWGSSSCSSKLVHGGLRYLQSGQPGVTYRSVREREALMKELPGLIRPLDFVLPVYSTKNRVLFKVGLMVYDIFAGKSYHHSVSAQAMKDAFVGLKSANLLGGYVYYDAQTDDMRLVMRILHDAENAGATIMNYAPLVEPLLEGSGVKGVKIQDRIDGTEHVIPCSVLVNATGANVDQLRKTLGLPKLIRPLRGSHLVFKNERLPVTKALAFSHPVDRRNVFLLPWLGVTFVGTTDLDHDAPADTLPVISGAERRYLLEAVNAMFPEANITEADVISTWSGVRPVVSSGAKDPSKESRDMFIDLDRGLLTVTGGKLTTFRNEAIHALAKLDGIFPALKGLRPRPFANPAMKQNTELSRYLSAAYGADAAGLESRLEQEPSPFFAGTQILKEAARYALEREWVVHLDDLMIRRLRLGILLPEGGKAVLGEIRTMCLKAGWSEDYYAQEEQRYKDLIAKSYS